MENLYIYEDPNSPPDWKDDIEKVEWLDLLLAFTAVKNLYPSKQFAPRIAPALQELTEGRITEVLPTLRGTFSWMGPSRQYRSARAFGSSFLRDSSSIALSPFRYGRETQRTRRYKEVHD